MTAMSRLALSFALLAAACSYRSADLTVVSTKNIDLSRAQLDARDGDRFEGEDCGFLELPNLGDAVDEALEKGGGNVMVDQVTYRTVKWLFLSCFKVEGTVLNAPTRDR